jgi:pimeloyl-ACP methyl ester carboxylesterase
MIKKLILAFIALVALLFAGVAVWMSVPFSYQKDLTAAALQSDQTISVALSPWLSFRPTSTEPSEGIIFYPGGKTAPDTFAPVMRALAKEGYLAVIVPMPLNTAFLGIDQAAEVMAANPQIKGWHLVGHSLGGVAAAEFAKTHADRLASLIFWASYPASDLHSLPIATVSIAAALDAESTPEKIALNKPKYPAATLFIEMPAANHWQYGYFADSLNTESNLRDRQSQIDELLQHTLTFIRQQQSVSTAAMQTKE